MVGQGVIMAYVDMNSKDAKVKSESIRVVNTVLPNVAKAVYRAMMVMYVDVQKYGDTRKQFGVKHDKVPALSISN